MHVSPTINGEKKTVLIGHTLKGRYRVYDRLGVGGAATVYLARDSQTGQMVIVKVVHSHLVNDKFIARFQREIDLLQKINNPHVICLHDWALRELDSDLNQLLSYIVAEFVEGHTLADIIDTRGPLEEANGLAIARQIALGLADIHRHGIIHRDIKSQNIMITPEDQAKLIDFGIAKGHDHATLTDPSHFAGTLYYAPPEQILEAHSVDHRADIYALGVVIYETLTTRLPVSAREFGTVASKIIAGELDPITGVSQPVEELVADMLAYRPEERPNSADEVVARIDEIIGDAQQPALPDRPAPPTTTLVRVPSEHPEGEKITPRFVLLDSMGRSIPIDRPLMVIGRSHPRDSAKPDIDLWALGIEGARTASRRHCQVFQEEGTFFVQDLGSMNGTLLNDQTLDPGNAYPLHEGDRIMAGRVLLTFQRAN